MEKPDQHKCGMTTEERLERAIDQIQRTVDATLIWEEMPAEEQRELTALILDSMLEVVRKHVPKCEPPTSGFKV